MAIARDCNSLSFGIRQFESGCPQVLFSIFNLILFFGLIIECPLWCSYEQANSSDFFSEHVSNDSNGISYSNLIISKNSSIPLVQGLQNVHIVEVNPEKFQIKLVKAHDSGLGRESVLSLSLRHGALAAINGGFFAIGGKFDGRACGALKINSWLALPSKPRGAIGWSLKNSAPIMDRVLTDLNINYQGIPLSFDREVGLNRERKTLDIVVYTPNFYPSTLSKSDGEEIIVRNRKIHSIKRSGSSFVPPNGFVLSLQKKHPNFGQFRENQKLDFSIEVLPQLGFTKSSDWEDLDYILGGTPLLVHDGRKVLDYASERTYVSFITRKHARASVGIKPNGNWLMVVVDKNHIYQGMSIDELSEFMLYLGCENALNLDGGGSSTLVYDKEIKNSPRGDEDEGFGKKTVRRVSDAIIIIPK